MCFSVAWLQSFLIWLVLIVAVIALLRLVVPWVLGLLGLGAGIIMQAINIVIWAIVAIAVIYFVFALISCLGGLSLPPMPHR